MATLPTADEMLNNAEQEVRRAYGLLGDAQDWLRSDWRPVGSALTTEQSNRKWQMVRAIADAKAALNDR